MGPLSVVRMVLRQKQLHFLALAHARPLVAWRLAEKAFVDDPTWPEL